MITNNHTVMKRILLIEDDPAMLRLTADILRMADYDVMTAENGKTGVEVAFREKPDLIISDTEMPILDGFGVFHMLQKNPHFVTTPFIFLNDQADQATGRKAMQLGADDVLPKPYSETDLLMAIECRLRKAEEIRDECRKVEREKIFSNHVSEAEVLSSFLDGRNIDRYSRKQRIYNEGTRPGKLYYIVKGKVKLTKASDEGKELVVELCGPGDFLGHIALLEDTSYKESAETIDFTEVAVIPRKEFEELVHEDTRIAQRFIKLLANNIAEKEKKLVGIAYNSLRKKVAEALMILREKFPPSGSDRFSINLNREDLANIAGTATESLIRTMSDFRTEKIIDIAKDGTISILNEHKLASLLK